MILWQKPNFFKHLSCFVSQFLKSLARVVVDNILLKIHNFRLLVSYYYLLFKNLKLNYSLIVLRIG